MPLNTKRYLPLVVANWKMHGSAAMAEALIKDIVVAEGAVECVLCPPFVYLPLAKEVLAFNDVLLGAQDCHARNEGAHTGDISAPMLREAGCHYVIVGHSERRAAYGETDAQVAEKAKAALAAGITPIMCVGESLQQREADEAETVVQASVSTVLEGLVNEFDTSEIVIAYEPVWAIGSGQTPTLHQIAEMHRAIRQTVENAFSAFASRLRIVYGGSVKPHNASEIGAIDGVDGFLVGGASLHAAEFNAISAAAEQKQEAA